MDRVLNIMVKGLEEELKERLNGGRKYMANSMSPSPQYEVIASIDDDNWGLSNTSAASASRKELPILRQGGLSISRITKVGKQAGRFVWHRFKKDSKT